MMTVRIADRTVASDVLATDVPGSDGAPEWDPTTLVLVEMPERGILLTPDRSRPGLATVCNAADAAPSPTS
jgi:hypothetical protein